MMKGKFVILSGSSGVGKDTVLEAWIAVNPNVQKVTAYTTRAPRSGEVEGVDYCFVTQKEFQYLILEGAFLEYKEVFGHYYGTPLKSVETLLTEGKIPVLKIDVQGGIEVIQEFPETLSIFLYPPSAEELERRIRSRGTDSDEEIQKRLSKASWEFKQAEAYQYRIVNDSIEDVIRQLEAIASK